MSWTIGVRSGAWANLIRTSHGRNGAAVVFFTLLFVYALGFTIVMIFLSDLWRQSCSLAVLAMMSFGYAFLYQRLYFGRHFDLVAKRPPATQFVPTE